MVSNNDTLQETILIKKARRRLVGAFTILITLLILSYFFLKDPQDAVKNSSVKVSFMQIFDENIDLLAKNNLNPSKTKNYLLNESEKFSSENEKNNFFIQIGIFSNTENAKKASFKIDRIGLQTKMIPIILNGQKKIQLVTSSFDDKKEADVALKKIKQAKLAGIIKKN